MFGKKSLKAKQDSIMKAVNEATARGQCVILSETPEGTRVIVIGKSIVQTQVDEILKSRYC
jgi:hypothetical protein